MTNNVCTLGAKKRHHLQSGRDERPTRITRKSIRTTDCVDKDESVKRDEYICAINRDVQGKGLTLFEPAAVASSLALNTTFLVGI